MGSEHYCLRWNNHQSNLLGVFSQLLESESLVDVTLACTEGPSIRAHKVVLSACSSYFQALFLDHPNRHPIVILKDVRFAELRTLVDFMYKGEVNVEYCQLSALLKTAESLKVKGLADMTNINAAAAVQASRDEPQPQPATQLSSSSSSTSSQSSSAQQQQQQQQLQSQSRQRSLSPSTTALSTTTSAAAASITASTATSATPANVAADRAEPMVQDLPDERHHRAAEGKESRERNSERDRTDKPRERRLSEHEQQESQMEATASHNDCSLDDAEITDCPGSPATGNATTIVTTPTTTSTTANTTAAAATTRPSSPRPLALDRPRSRRDSDSPASLEETRGSLSPLSAHSGPSDMSLSNNNNNNNNNGATACTNQGTTPVTIPIGSLPQSRLPSPHSTEPLAGPSGLPPVQQVPLSLKKEVDWERSTEERSASSEMSSDYRLPPDPVSLALGLESSGWAGLAPGDLVAAAAASGEHGSALLTSAGFAAGLAGLARRCGVCLASFPSSWLLERHALLQHAGLPGDDKPFTCEQCGQRYRYRSAYVKHREQNHRARLPADKLFTCEVCGMQFRYLKSFKKHRLNHALERLQRAPSSESQALTERSDQVSSTGEPSQLETGSAGDASPLQLDSEVEREGRGGRDTPSEPREEAGSSETASLHEHATESGDGLEPGPRTALAASPSSEPEDEERPEDASPAGLTTTGAVAAATTTISGSSSSPVPGSISTSLNLTLGGSRGGGPGGNGPAAARAGSHHHHHHHHHHDVDRRERRFACPFCGKCVRSKENLKLHVRKHTGERPFVCLFCGRAFGGKSDLTRHLRIHTGERPYHCEMCGKCFARADYLSKHLTTHIHQR